MLVNGFAQQRPPVVMGPCARAQLRTRQGRRRSRGRHLVPRV